MISSEPRKSLALGRLGFTGLESEALEFLLGQGEAVTAYRVAQALGKPPAAVYKALESLDEKGALLVEDAGHRLFRAVPIAELLGQYERQFRRTADELLNVWTETDLDPADDRVYRLGTSDQVLERFAAMLERCEQFAQATVCPPLIDVCRAPLEAAAARGRFLSVKVFAPAQLEGVRRVQDPRGLQAFEHAPGAWIHLVVDGREALSALFDDAGTQMHFAIWTASPFLCWGLFTGLFSNHALAAVESAFAAGADARGIKQAIEDLEPPGGSQSAGKRLVFQRYRAGGRRGRRKGT